jgi:hypothetical protein
MVEAWFLRPGPVGALLVVGAKGHDIAVSGFGTTTPVAHAAETVHIDAAMSYDHFSLAVFYHLEAYEFCDRNRAREHIADGNIELDEPREYARRVDRGGLRARHEPYPRRGASVAGSTACV